MSDWGSSLHSYPTAQINGHENGERPVTLLVIGEPQRVQGLYAAFLGDARFQVLATATTPEDVRAKLAMEPEAVVAEGTVFHGPEALAAAFAACPLEVAAPPMSTTLATNASGTRTTDRPTLTSFFMFDQWSQLERLARSGCASCTVV